MSEHYYSQKPQSESAPRTWKAELRGHYFTFTSDVGVFSKNTVDFGTRLLIDQFNEPTIPGAILDLGCGYGPIGMSLAASYPDRTIIMADVNERAVELAKENIRNNSIENAEVLESDRLDNLQTNSFAAIVINPPIRAGKKVVYKMFEESLDALCHKGELWIVIQQKQGAPSAKKKLVSLFANVEVVAKKKGYFIFRMIKG